MSAKHRFNVTNRPADMADRIRTAARRHFVQQLDEIDALSEPVTTPFKVDPSSRNAGEQFLTNAH